MLKRSLLGFGAACALGSAAIAQPANTLPVIPGPQGYVTATPVCIVIQTGGACLNPSGGGSGSGGAIYGVNGTSAMSLSNPLAVGGSAGTPFTQGTGAAGANSEDINIGGVASGVTFPVTGAIYGVNGTSAMSLSNPLAVGGSAGTPFTQGTGAAGANSEDINIGGVASGVTFPVTGAIYGVNGTSAMSLSNPLAVGGSAGTPFTQGTGAAGANSEDINIGGVASGVTFPVTGAIYGVNGTSAMSLSNPLAVGGSAGTPFTQGTGAAGANSEDINIGGVASGVTFPVTGAIYGVNGTSAMSLSNPLAVGGSAGTPFTQGTGAAGANSEDINIGGVASGVGIGAQTAQIQISLPVGVVTTPLFNFTGGVATFDLRITASLGTTYWLTVSYDAGVTTTVLPCARIDGSQITNGAALVAGSTSAIPAPSIVRCNLAGPALVYLNVTATTTNAATAEIESTSAALAIPYTTATINQGTPGTTNGVSEVPHQVALFSPVATAGASTTTVSGAKNLYTAYLTNTDTVAHWLWIVNTTTAPTNGSFSAGTASGNVQDCIEVAAGTTGSIGGLPIPENFSQGPYLANSTTGCGGSSNTLTLSTVGFLHELAK